MQKYTILTQKWCNCLLFFCQLSLEANPAEQTQLLLTQLSQRQHEKQFWRVWQQANLAFENDEILDAQQLKYCSTLQNSANHWQSQTKGHQTANHLQAQSKYFDAYYLATQLATACEMKNREAVLNIQFDLPLATHFLPLVSQHPQLYLQNMEVKLWYNLLMCLQHEDDPLYFNQLLEELTLLQDKAPAETAKAVYVHVQNYCIRKINAGLPDFLPQIMLIYRTQLQREWLFDALGFLSEWHYKNIVTVGLRLNEHQFIRNFIETYRAKLPPSVAYNAYNFNLATWYYFTKQHRQAMNLLLQVTFTDPVYQLDARALLLKIYFESEETDAFFALCDSFKIFLTRHKTLSKRQQEGYSNLLRFARRAFTVRNKKDYIKKMTWQTELEQLRQQIVKTTPIANLSWLNQQVNEL